MGYLHELGPVAIASRLKSITDLLVRDMARVYRAQDVDFEPRWFTFIHLIHARGPLPITSIARELGQTHPASNQVANALERKGYTRSRKDRNDNRKRIIALTPLGQQLVTELIPIWEAVDYAAGELLRESCPEFLHHLDSIETQLMETPMDTRVFRRIAAGNNDDVQIIPFTDDRASFFRSLNEEWLLEFFSVEPEDERLISNPRAEIIDKGGTVVFAAVEGRIVGTGALLHVNDKVCELTKMAVTNAFRGRKIGRKLLEHLMATAREKKYESIELLTSDKLTRAVALYKSAGFVPDTDGAGREYNYQRCSILMKLDLQSNNKYLQT